MNFAHTLALSACSLCVLSGCSSRTITVTSTPVGASVWINDQAVGRTPVTADFTYFGTYDVRVELDGYVPVSEPRSADAPWWEWPGLDAIAIAIPFERRTEIEWHFDLVEEDAVEDLLLERAWATRWMTEFDEEKKPSDAESPADTSVADDVSVPERASGDADDGGAGSELTPDNGSGTNDARGSDD